MNDEYPKQMVHPDHSPAILSSGHVGMAGAGRPERFPLVMVHAPDQEERERSRGYLLPGEPRPKVDGYYEYPMMMEHPDYEPEVKPYLEGREIDGSIQTFMVQGKPGQFPPVMVKDAKEADVWREKGYVSGGHADGRAYERAMAHVSADYNPDEWPKYVDGVLMKNPTTPVDLDEYPKYVVPAAGGAAVVVATWEEECEVTGRGSSKNEPVKRSEPIAAADDADYAEFLAWKTAKAEAEANRLTVGDVVSEHTQLVADAEALGVTVDKRWGDRRLREEIEHALEKTAAE